jgi:hypothetical protein
LFLITWPSKEAIVVILKIPYKAYTLPKSFISFRAQLFESFL